MKQQFDAVLFGSSFRILDINHMNIIEGIAKSISLLRQKNHRTTFLRLFFVYPSPLRFLKRYLTKSGQYPSKLNVRVREKTLELALFSAHDLDTANQVFCRLDYPVSPEDSVFLDLGANIGLVSKFFAAVSKKPTVYSYEPAIQNHDRFETNCGGLKTQVNLIKAAVSDFSGAAQFSYENTGRYGSLVTESNARTYEVEVKSVVNIIDEIFSKHEKLDVLKIDVEGLEEKILQAIPERQLVRIGKIFAEYQGAFVPSGFAAEKYGFVTRYYNQNSH